MYHTAAYENLCTYAGRALLQNGFIRCQLNDVPCEKIQRLRYGYKYTNTDTDTCIDDEVQIQ